MQSTIHKNSLIPPLQFKNITSTKTYEISRYKTEKADIYSTPQPSQEPRLPSKATASVC